MHISFWLAHTMLIELISPAQELRDSSRTRTQRIVFRIVQHAMR